MKIAIDASKFTRDELIKYITDRIDFKISIINSEDWLMDELRIIMDKYPKAHIKVWG